MLLRNVLEGYLSGVTERQFDLPFLLLLPEMGFFDVHYTHGTVEFGKDFIAKRLHDGEIVQYSFQSKAGDIRQSAWRGIQEQLLEALVNPLVHPNFDVELQHQHVLVTTGDLIGNAGLGMQGLNQRVASTGLGLPVQLWAKATLIDNLLDHGLAGILHATPNNAENLANYLSLYARTLRGDVTSSNIEYYTASWLNSAGDTQSLLKCAIESEILAQSSLANGNIYEATMARLAFIRYMCALAYTDGLPDLSEIYQAATQGLHAVCNSYALSLENLLLDHEDLLSARRLDPANYLVQCMRTLELAGLAYFTTRDEPTRARLSRFMASLINTEPGCSHPLSDRYSVSLAIAGVVLACEHNYDTLRAFLFEVCCWVCDRYEHDIGLGGIEDDESVEVATILGAAYSFTEPPQGKQSFIATLLIDLAAYLGDPSTYGDIVNDLKAVGLHPVYRQPQDSEAACLVDHQDILNYPSVIVDETLSRAFGYHASHWQDEPATYQFCDRFGVEASMMCAILLRDRYFPSQWPLLVPNHLSGVPPKHDCIDDHVADANHHPNTISSSSDTL